MSKDRELFKVTAVKVRDGSCLLLTYADGARQDVNLTGWIKSTKALRLLRDPKLFATARIGSFGYAIEFGDGSIDLASDNLRNLAVEQAGGIGHERIWKWMQDNNLTIDQAAEVLGISRRMLIYYRNGEKVIPRHIWLACVGWETLQKHRIAA